MTLQTLKTIVEKICGDKKLQVGRDVVLINEPAKVCFVFNEEEFRLYNSKSMTVEEVSQFARKYRLVPENSEPITFPDNSVGYQFKLNKGRYQR